MGKCMSSNFLASSALSPITTNRMYPAGRGLPLKWGALLSGIASGLVFFKYLEIWALTLKIAIKIALKRARVSKEHLNSVCSKECLKRAQFLLHIFVILIAIYRCSFCKSSGSAIFSDNFCKWCVSQFVLQLHIAKNRNSQSLLTHSWLQNNFFPDF